MLILNEMATKPIWVLQPIEKNKRVSWKDGYLIGKLAKPIEAILLKENVPIFEDCCSCISKLLTPRYISRDVVISFYLKRAQSHSKRSWNIESSPFPSLHDLNNIIALLKYLETQRKTLYCDTPLSGLPLLPLASNKISLISQKQVHYLGDETLISLFPDQIDNFAHLQLPTDFQESLFLHPIDDKAIDTIYKKGIKQEWIGKEKVRIPDGKWKDWLYKFLEFVTKNRLKLPTDVPIIPCQNGNNFSLFTLLTPD